jgi:flagellar export protein FliJ
MPFRFRLISLLRIRAVREELERERLLVSQLKCREAEYALLQLHSRTLQSREAFLGADRAINGSQLHFFEACSAEDQKAETVAKTKLAAAVKERDSQRYRFELAHKDSAVLEKLQERHRKDFQIQESRKEQRSLDEAFTLAKGLQTRQGLPND